MDYLELEDDLVNLVNSWIIDDWWWHEELLSSITPLLHTGNSEETEHYYTSIVPLFLDPSSIIYPHTVKGSAASRYPFEFIVDALMSDRCPPAVLSEACRCRHSLYRTVASQNHNCPEEDRVYVALSDNAGVSFP